MWKPTAKQQRFVDEMIIDGNRTRSAIAAGCNPVGARVQGSRWYANPNLKKLIDEGTVKKAEATGITADVVMRKLSRLVLTDIDPKTMTVKDHIRALELAAKLLGMLVEKQEVKITETLSPTERLDAIRAMIDKAKGSTETK